MPVRSLVTPRLGSIVAIAALAVSAIGAVVATRTTTPPNILVVKTGTGGGTVVADVGLLNCGATCTDLVPTGTLVTLLATPNLDSQFVGWLGPCTGRGLCTFQAGSAKTMTAAFAPKSLGVPGIDIDGNGLYDPLTDGILILRWLFGISGQELIGGVIGSSATRVTAAQVSAYLTEVRAALDIDGDGRVDALTDGLLIVRYLFGLRGSTLATGTLAPGATRTTSDSLQTQIETLVGSGQTISFLSSPPTDAMANGPTYSVAATATSGLPVLFSIGAAATSVCAVAGSTVSFLAAGNCIVNADQPGNGSYAPAPRVQQSFMVRAEASGSSYATEFPAQENPLSESGRWINGKSAGIDWNDAQSAGGIAFGAAVVTGYNDDIAVLNTAFGPNQYAQGTVFRVPGYSPAVSHEIELLLHFQISAHNARGYEVLWGHSGELNIVRWNGPLGNYTPIVGTTGPNIGPAVDGDVLRAEIRNGIISVYKNGAPVLTGPADSTWTDGQPGIGFWPTTGSTPQNYGWKSFQAGGL